MHRNIRKESNMEINISEIKRSTRTRKDLGDIGELADSIQRVGLLNPITLDQDNRLVAGARRVAAFKKLGRTSIPYTIAEAANEATKRLQAERDENTVRKGFTPSEAVAMARKIREAVKPEADAAQAEGRRAGGGDRRSKVADRLRAKNPQAVDGESGRTATKAAVSVGMSRRTLEKAEAVVNAAGEDPDTYGPLAKQMDKDGKVEPAYNAMQAIKGKMKKASTGARKGTGRKFWVMDTKTFEELGAIAAEFAKVIDCVAFQIDHQALFRLSKNLNTLIERVSQ
jgi:ParB-like chromosome segregation protein Spo0J